MEIEALRIAFIVVGGLLALALFLGPRLACRFYAAALVKGRDGAAGFWAALAAGGGSSSGPSFGDFHDDGTYRRHNDPAGRGGS